MKSGVLKARIIVSCFQHSDILTALPRGYHPWLLSLAPLAQRSAAKDCKNHQHKQDVVLAEHNYEARSSFSRQLQQRWIEDDVLDSLPLPSVGYVNLAVRGLNHGRIGVLAGLALKGDDRLPMLAING